MQGTPVPKGVAKFEDLASKKGVTVRFGDFSRQSTDRLRRARLMRVECCAVVAFFAVW